MNISKETLKIGQTTTTNFKSVNDQITVNVVSNIKFDY